MNLKGSRTEKNIMSAFAGESQARNRYTYYASIADKEGFRKIRMVFEETADHEKEHAKRLFKLFEDRSYPVEINPEDSAFPTVFGNTAQNLKSAAEGENHENQEMYPNYAKIAREEGFEDIAKTFESIAEAEKYHERRFLALLKKVEEGSAFKAEKAVVWKCLNCGYHTIDESTEAPIKCPACDHAQKHFEIAVIDY